MKKVTLTFIVPDIAMKSGMDIEYELEHGNFEYAVGKLEEESLTSDYCIEDTEG